MERLEENHPGAKNKMEEYGLSIIGLASVPDKLSN